MLHRKASPNVFNKMNYYKQADYVTASGRHANIIERIAPPPPAFQSESNDFSCYLALKNAQAKSIAATTTTTNASSSANTTTTTNHSGEPKSTSSISSSEIFTDYDETGRLINNSVSCTANNGLVCLTDGSYTSYKFLGGQASQVASIVNNQLLLKNNQTAAINEKYCFVFAYFCSLFTSILLFL